MMLVSFPVCTLSWRRRIPRQEHPDNTPSRRPDQGHGHNCKRCENLPQSRHGHIAQAPSVRHRKRRRVGRRYGALCIRGLGSYITVGMQGCQNAVSAKVLSRAACTSATKRSRLGNYFHRWSRTRFSFNRGRARAPSPVSNSFEFELQGWRVLGVRVRVTTEDDRRIAGAELVRWKRGISEAHQLTLLIFSFLVHGSIA